LNYLKILDEAFDASDQATLKIHSTSDAATPLKVGAFGDTTYRIDKVAEDAIIQVIQQHLPSSLIVSEEAGRIGDPDGSPLVLIDPIDGSTNASRGVPFYSSAIVIIEGHQFEDVAAAGVFDLVHKERIISGGDGKVTLNRQQTHPTSAKPLDKAYINVNLRSKSPEKDDHSLHALLQQAKYPRFLGSAALETAYVAIGRSDAFLQIAPNLRTFDCIGALFMVQEAGGWFKCLNTDLYNADLRGSERFAYVAACDAEMGETILSVKP
jgi:myo-inositol-1(or 4)-monophosphatase